MTTSVRDIQEIKRLKQRVEALEARVAELERPIVRSAIFEDDKLDKRSREYRASIGR